MSDAAPERKFSRAHKRFRRLLKILRHAAVDLGLKMDKKGFVKLDDVLKVEYMQVYNAQEIKDQVAKFKGTEKEAFEIKESASGDKIRACSGHTGAVAKHMGVKDSGLKPREPDEPKQSRRKRGRPRKTSRRKASKKASKKSHRRRRKSSKNNLAVVAAKPPRKLPRNPVAVAANLPRNNLAAVAVKPPRKLLKIPSS